MHHEHLVLEERRRRPRPPAPLVGVVLDVARPDEAAVEVVGEQPEVAEEHVQARAVGHGGGGGERVLRVDARGHGAAVRGALPHEVAARQVVAEHQPMVGARRRVRRRLGAARGKVEACLRALVVLVGHHGGDEHPGRPRRSGSTTPAPESGPSTRRSPSCSSSRAALDRRRSRLSRPGAAEPRPVLGRRGARPVRTAPPRRRSPRQSPGRSFVSQVLRPPRAEAARRRSVVLRPRADPLPDDVDLGGRQEGCAGRHPVADDARAALELEYQVAGLRGRSARPGRASPGTPDGSRVARRTARPGGRESPSTAWSPWCSTHDGLKISRWMLVSVGCRPAGGAIGTVGRVGESLPHAAPAATSDSRATVRRGLIDDYLTQRAAWDPSGSASAGHRTRRDAAGRRHAASTARIRAARRPVAVPRVRPVPAASAARSYR